MATQTPKLGLPRPEPTDNVTLANHNALVDAIDAGAASQSELDSVNTSLSSHIGNKSNPHGVTAAQVGLGNVDNAKQATKTEFDAHVNNKSNPHGVTAAQVGAETPTGAQTKANTAEQNAINWAKSFGLGANIPLASDLNTLPIAAGTGFYMTGDNTKNTPPGIYGNGAVIHIARDSRPSQIFSSYSTGRMFHRGYTADGWQQWYEIWTSASLDPNTKLNVAGGKLTGNVTFEGGARPRVQAASATSDIFVEFLDYLGARSSMVGRINAGTATGAFLQNSVGSGKRLTLLDDGRLMYGADEVWTGTNNAASIGSSGYQKLASGLILQWGVSTPPTPGSYTITFPIAFPTRPCFGNVSAYMVQSNETATTTVYELTTTNMAVNFQYGGSVHGGGRGYTWLAIGY